MIAKCEKCNTAFNIDDSLIKEEGTKFRCSNCKQIFTLFPKRPEKRKVKKKKDEDTMTMVDFSQDVFDRFDKSAERYVELGVIGEGGMGEVKEARDSKLLRKVAIKALKKEAAASPAALSYFIREAQITAQLDHPNIVPLYTVKEPVTKDENVSFVMKLIKGQTLTDIITKARNIYKDNPKADLPDDLNINSRLGYFLKACEGVIYAHKKEVIHRDLKPANIMIGDYGEVYVMDWGIAKMIKEIPRTLQGIEKVAAQKPGMYVGGTEMGSVVGTPGYISPEQIRGLPDVGRPSDQFSLGVILYELVTLKPARPGSMQKRLEWAEKGYINQIAHIVPEQRIAPELKAIIRKATAFKPEDRYPSVAMLAEDVRKFLRGDEISQLPDNLPRKIWRWMNKHRHLAVIMILSFLLISSTITIGSLFRERSSMRTSRMREKKLTYLLTKVAAQAHYIDSRFIRLEDLLIGLANNAMYLIQHGPENHEKLYWLDDFNNPEKAPPDLTQSPLYGKPVSIDYPVVKLAPGVKAKDVIDIMHRLAPLRYHYKKMFLDSRNSFSPLTEEEARRLMTIHGLPISWAYIGLEAGVMYSYPGKGKYPKGYDPRVRPWYRLGAHKNAVYWGNPYIDVQGLGMVLPCATSLYDDEGNFYGVVGMDVTYSNIIRDSLTRSGAIGVVESFLLDDKGRIVVSSKQLGVDVEKYSTDSALRLERFPVKGVVEKVQRKESGFVEVVREEEKRIIFFHEIPSLSWYYVEEIRSSAVLGEDD